MRNLFLLILLATNLIAIEDIGCSSYYDNVARKIKNINDNAGNLSKLAQEKLYRDLKFEIGECISRCEEDKFKFCNNAAKQIESY